MTAFTWGAYRAAAAEAMDGANLNSLASLCAAAAGEASDTITDIDNTSNGDYYGDFYLDLASLNITAVGGVDLFLIPVGSDGTTFPHYVIDHTTTGNVKLPSHYFAAQFQFNILNGAQMQVLTGIQLPKCKFRPAVYNRLGVAWAASGNTLKYRSYSDLGT